MYGLIRWIGLALLFYIAMKVVRKLLVAANTPPRPRYDSGKEVKNASYRSEDVQDAKFKDIK